MSYRLPLFTPFGDEEKVRIETPDGLAISNSDPDSLWTVRSNGDHWSFEDPEGVPFMQTEDWSLRWSSHPDHVYLYRTRTEPDPDPPVVGEEPVGYYWNETRLQYLRRITGTTLEWVDRTYDTEEPDETYAWVFRNQTVRSTRTITSQVTMQSGGNVETDTVKTRFLRVPAFDPSTWNQQSQLTLFGVDAENVIVEDLNTQTLGTVSFPASFRDRASICIVDPDTYQTVGLDSDAAWTIRDSETAWTLSIPTGDNTWTVTSSDPVDSVPGVRFQVLATRPGHAILRVIDNRALYLTRTAQGLQWQDLTDVQSSPTFETDYPNIQWFVRSPRQPATSDRYAKHIAGTIVRSDGPTTDGTITVRHETLAERNIAVPQTFNLLKTIGTDAFGHVVSLEEYGEEESSIAKRSSVFQYEQRGWDSVGTVNDLELFQDWIGVTRDQFGNTWWTRPVLKSASPEPLGPTTVSGSLSAKFVDAVTTPDGTVLFVPHQSSRALLFDPLAYTVRELDFGSPVNTNDPSFAGGVMVETGEIACVPYNESRLAFVRGPSWIPRFTDPIPGVGSSGRRFFGGARMNDGEIACAPFDASIVPVYDPRLETWNTYPLPPDLTTTSEMFRGAVACPDGQVICIPHNSDRFLHVLENATLVTRVEPSPGQDGLYRIPDENRIKRYFPGAFGTVAELEDRQSDVIIEMTARFPTPDEVQDDMCLFNAGATVRAVYFGLRRLGPVVEFYARAGDSSPPPNQSSTILQFQNPSFLDGRVHNLKVDIRTDPGRMRVFIDDVLQGQREIRVRLADQADDAPQWAGPHPGNMYGGTFQGQTPASTPFIEQGVQMSNANWFGFPHSLVSSVDLYAGQLTTVTERLPRLAVQNWSRDWIQPIDTPRLNGYATMADVDESNYSFWRIQREWRDVEGAPYPISIGTSAFPRNPRATPDKIADTTDPQWNNWRFDAPSDWEFRATTEDATNGFGLFHAFRDTNAPWRSTRIDEPQSLFVRCARPVRPHGYSIRAWYNDSDGVRNFRPVEWKVWGITEGNERIELHHAPGESLGNNPDPNSRTRTYVIDTTTLFREFELQIFSVFPQDADRVALEQWDMFLFPDEEDGRPVWRAMNKRTPNGGWRVFGSNVLGSDAIVTYHEPRRVHEISIRSLAAESDGTIGIRTVEIQGKNVSDPTWTTITRQENAWSEPLQDVTWTLSEPSNPYEMVRAVITESDSTTHVGIEEWNLRTSAPLPVPDMFDNTDPFVVESGGEHGKGPGAFWGGVFSSNGIVCIPHGSDRIGIYDVSTRTFSDDGPEVGTGTYAGGRSLPNGMVLLCPYSSNANLSIYDPTRNEIVREFSIPNQAEGSFSGASLTFDGQVALSPYNASTVRVVDTGLVPHPALVTHPSVN